MREQLIRGEQARGQAEFQGGQAVQNSVSGHRKGIYCKFIMRGGRNDS